MLPQGILHTAKHDLCGPDSGQHSSNQALCPQPRWALCEICVKGYIMSVEVASLALAVVLYPSSFRSSSLSLRSGLASTCAALALSIKLPNQC